MDVLHQPTAPTSAATRAAIIKTTALKPVIRNSVAEAEKVMARADGAQPDAAEPTSRTTSRSSTGRPSRSPSTSSRASSIGFTEAIAEMAAPYDDETLERFIGEVKPLVEAA